MAQAAMVQATRRICPREFASVRARLLARRWARTTQAMRDYL